MKTTHIRNLTAVLAILTFTIAGIALAQSDSRPSGTPKPAAAAAQSPELIALSFYADWCPGCKALAPKVEQVMNDSASQTCLFVKLDQTDKNSHQAEYMLAALRLGNLWKEHAGKTGYVLLVNPRTNKVVAQLTADQDVESMQAAIVRAIDG